VRHTDIQAYRHTGIEVYRYTNRHTGIQAYRHTSIQAYKHAGQAGIQACMIQAYSRHNDMIRDRRFIGVSIMHRSKRRRGDGRCEMHYI